MNRKNAARGTLLLVDDDRHILESMSSWLADQGYEIRVAGSVSEADAQLRQRAFDVVLCDIRLGSGDGFQVLSRCRELHPDTPVLLITGYGTVEMGVEAIRAGAFDLLTKPIMDQELELAIERALSQRTVIEENKNLKAQLDYRYGMDRIVGRDHRMQRIFEVVQSVADTRATILITGESGTGKSLLAHSIHRQSARRDRPFVSVACGALPETLLESELFGHVVGAFTGATCNKIGKFKQADTGTIFLDEIGTSSPSMQVKLLRVLQDLEFEPVGGTETHKVDTRVILATNEDLMAAVAAGRFRQDLFYRINVIAIEIPPLRDRVSDIPSLAQLFLDQVRQDTGKEVDGFTESAMLVLQNYRWPGNVRELQNVVERSVLLGRHRVIEVDDLPPDLFAGCSIPTAPRSKPRTLKEALEAPERQIILEVLEAHQWNRNTTADELGINRTTLYKKMKRLGLDDERRPVPYLP